MANKLILRNMSVKGAPEYVFMIGFFLMGWLALFPFAAYAGDILATPRAIVGHGYQLGSVYLYEIQDDGAMVSLNTIPGTLTNNPAATVFNSKGELFVSNRHYNSSGGGGSISRFIIDSNGNYTPNGTITGNSLEAVHGLVFSAKGELFAANYFNNKISRFIFDENGVAKPNGTITAAAGYVHGVAISPDGELFVSHGPIGRISRFVFDANGNAIANGYFVVSGYGAVTGLRFHSNGELFISTTNNAIFRYSFQYRNPVLAGTIVTSGPGTDAPSGMAFSSSGELFVSTHYSGHIERFLFDAQGNSTKNGIVPVTDHLGNVDIFIQPDPVTANAGVDQLVECPGSSGTSVTLDGSGSSGPEGSSLTYTWTWPGGSAEGVNPTITLPLGTTIVTLTVSDGRTTATDTVNITVQDTISPITTATGWSDNWYNANVISSFSAADSCSGVKEIHYTVNGTETVVSGDSASLTLTNDGTYNIAYYSIDNAGKAESPNGMTVKIDKTPPVLSLSTNPNTLWPPNHKMTNVLIGGNATDATSGIASVAFTVTDEYGTVQPSISNFNTAIQLEAWREGTDKDGRHYTITAVAADAAGNKTTTSTTVLVPHDQGKK